MNTLTKAQVKENRIKWGEYLLNPGLKQAIGRLENGYGGMCCLGHACHLFGIERRVGDIGIFLFGQDGREACAPKELMSLVGLSRRWGEINNQSGSLSYFNDTGMSLPEIGRIILAGVEGGNGTPFRPLSDYPE